MDDLTLHLKKLTPVKAGDTPESVLTASRVNALQSSILLLAAGANVKTAGGITKASFSSSFIIRGQQQESPGGEERVCELGMKNASDQSGFKVTFAWGRIANRQPTGFDTNGMIVPLVVEDDAAYHYFYAKCTADPVTLTWTAAEIYQSTDVALANTATIAYYLLGSAKVIDRVLTLSPPTCGPIVPSLCDLLSYYPYV